MDPSKFTDSPHLCLRLRTDMTIQLFQEKFSYKRGKAYSKMSDVIMGNRWWFRRWLIEFEAQGVSA